MDDRRLDRIENMLSTLVRDSLPRREFESRFNRLEARVGKALDGLARLETRLEHYSDLEGRVDEIENITIPAREKHNRRMYFWPTIATILGVVINGTLAAVTLALH